MQINFADVLVKEITGGTYNRFKYVIEMFKYNFFNYLNRDHH